MTKDLGGNARTADVTDAVCAEIQKYFKGKNSA